MDTSPGRSAFNSICNRNLNYWCNDMLVLSSNHIPSVSIGLVCTRVYVTNSRAHNQKCIQSVTSSLFVANINFCRDQIPMKAHMPVCLSFYQVTSLLSTMQAAPNTWRRSPMYGRDIVSYYYLRLRNLCRPPWLTNDGVLWNVYSVAYLVCPVTPKGIVFVVGLTQSVAAIK